MFYLPINQIVNNNDSHAQTGEESLENNSSKLNQRGSTKFLLGLN